MTTIRTSTAWTRLLDHRQSILTEHMRDLFDADPRRFSRFSCQGCGILLDYSKNRITEETLSLLHALARERQILARRDAMLAGEHVNVSEDRPALHVALRDNPQRPVCRVEPSVHRAVEAVLERLGGFAEDVRCGRWRGYTGKPISDVVNIGIGGSDLGPKMVCRALEPYANSGLRTHFVSNVDGTHLAQTLQGRSAESTLFVVCSKTFTTKETLLNARSARDWLVAQLGDEDAVARHFVAVSTNLEAVNAFGIASKNMFEFWDWVGGRYSLWSAIGASIVLQVGMPAFRDLLAGAHAMDRHFRDAPPEQNLPLILALIGVWNANFLGADSLAVLPYDQSLEHFPAYLQQLDMESNGKSVRFDGEPVAHTTGPVLWGAPGTNGQHAFYQLLHQGTRVVAADFLVPAQSHHPTGEHHRILLANCFAQSEALMRGKRAKEVREEIVAAGVVGPQVGALLPHKVFEGNRSSNTLLFKTLDPYTLGALIALYEHKVFLQGALWQVNSFDQWGVELGKQLAGVIAAELGREGTTTDHDSSTNGLIDHCKSLAGTADPGPRQVT